MISTATGIIFQAFEADPNAAAYPDTLDESVQSVSSNNAYLTSSLSGLESWLDTVWWFQCQFPRKFTPSEFDLSTALLADWIEVFKQAGGVENVKHSNSGKFSLPLPRRSEHPNRFKDLLYFIFSWSGYREPIDLLTPVLEGSVSIQLAFVSILESPIPTTAAPGRVFQIGVQMSEQSEALPRKRVNTPIDI